MSFGHPAGCYEPLDAAGVFFVRDVLQDLADDPANITEKERLATSAATHH